MFFGGCLYFMCVYCMLSYKSNKIHRYSVNTYYVQSTVLGANQYKFYSKPLPVTGCVILGKSLNSCVPHFPYL